MFFRECFVSKAVKGKELVIHGDGGYTMPVL